MHAACSLRRGCRLVGYTMYIRARKTPSLPPSFPPSFPPYTFGALRRTASALSPLPLFLPSSASIGASPPRPPFDYNFKATGRESESEVERERAEAVRESPVAPLAGLLLTAGRGPGCG